ncbi:hypothetical protein CHLNCDRAFT_134525 [Chlorella variabilis]|uniref:SET domain-containing protein n=1 Tax=Chlorella variabilis TaxID=554065 RepID=E1ZG54_CHLVA|nr:hypothetical protein CHLNCDRAFT_134525 [Chlorella variabilis]EFN55406.1 hypothetical protein CHLNCDRAFT_134525 [Chlorella variabilis]|eukprot:XP_005847508.1 hypothetical protein CHLNCDRAFT_134525 [Chlorella variabilis]
MSPRVLREFQAWMESVGIEPNSDAIELVDAAQGCSGLALGVRAVRDVAEGERLCAIPKAACLSIRTTQLADVIEAEELGGGLGLVLAVMHEMSLGAESRWHGYFAALPPREYLPLFWSDAQLRLLAGTELEGSAESDREASAEDFEEHVLPLLHKYPGRLRPAACTLDRFRVAASFVGSRAFCVDEWHGDAMVPLADIFNHKASVVELGAGYEVHGAQSSSDDDDDEEEEDEEEEELEGEDEEGSAEQEGESEEEEEAEHGSSGGSESGSGSGGSEDGAGARASGWPHRHQGGCCGSDAPHAHAQARGSGRRHGSREEDGCEGGLPAVMGSRPASIYGLTSANGLHLRLEMAIVDLDAHTLQIVAASAVPAGAEVHNTYGELGNAELVKKYGFALRYNPFTAVQLDKAALLAAARGALGPARWRRRSGLLRRESDVLEEGEEPFEALPNGHISPALFVALRVLCAPDEEAAGWSGIADALRLPAAAAGRAGGGGQEQPQPELGAVQVWQVLDGDGRPLAAAAGAAAAAAAAPAAAGDGGEQPAQGAAQQYAALLDRGMCELLQGAVRQRQDEYASPLEQDLRQLEAAAQQATAATAVAEGEEQQVAQRSALLLRVTEQEVLRDLLAALERRLVALPGDEQAADGQAAGEGAADGQQQHQQQHQQHQQQERRKPAGKRKAGGAAASTLQNAQPSDRGVPRQNGSGR